jgi:putative addiction module antidote
MNVQQTEHFNQLGGTDNTCWLIYTQLHQEQTMLRKVFKTGNSVVISLPKDALELLGISEGSDVSIDLDRENRQIVISSAEGPLAVAGVDEQFAQQVAEFIDQYRPALEALAKS